MSTVPDAPLSPANEAIARRVAAILASENPQAARTTVTGHHTIVCKVCRLSFDADHENPHAGGCNGNPMQSHDFYGMDSIERQA